MHLVYQWGGFKSRRGKNKHLPALKSNSNTGWFNFQTYIYIYVYVLKRDIKYKVQRPRPLDHIY
jgi:hypothetical protein